MLGAPGPQGDPRGERKSREPAACLEETPLPRGCPGPLTRTAPPCLGLCPPPAVSPSTGVYVQEEAHQVTARKWRQPECPSTEAQRNKMWNITPPEKGVKPDTGYNVDNPQNVVLSEGKTPVATQCAIPWKCHK